MTFHTDNESNGPQGFGLRPPGANARLLIGFLAGSAVVHAAALVVLPGFQPDDRDRTPMRVLEAVIVQAEPPRIIEQPPPSPQPQRRTPERVARAPLPPEPPRHLDAPVLALPEPRSQAESAFTVPSPKPAETPAAEARRTEVASVAVSPPTFGASYLGNPKPAYPLAAHRYGIQGTVMLRVLVSREGLPSRVELEKSSGSAPLDQAALDAVKTWRFIPARRGAEPIEDVVIFPVAFRLEGGARR